MQRREFKDCFYSVIENILRVLTFTGESFAMDAVHSRVFLIELPRITFSIDRSNILACHTRIFLVKFETKLCFMTFPLTKETNFIFFSAALYHLLARELTVSGIAFTAGLH